MKKSVIAGIIFMALIIGYGFIVIHGIKNMQDWAWSGFAWFPLAIFCGLGCAVSNMYWDKEKKEKEKEGRK